MNITLYRNPSRALSAWAPFYSPMSILDEINQIAEEFSRRVGFDGNALIPATDIYEKKDELVVKTELPGINEKDLEVTIKGDILTIKAERKEEETEDTTHPNRERYYGKYVRSMTLPYHVNEDKTSATFQNGTLELRFAKAAETKAKRIEVKAQLPQGERKKRQRKPKTKASEIII